MTFKELAEKLKLDWCNTFIAADVGLLEKHRFQITPRDFLMFSKEDFRSDSVRGLVSALTNAKRAIDCQTDAVLKSFGYDPTKPFNKIVSNYIKQYQVKFGKLDTTLKLKLLQSLDVAPSVLVSKIRNLRNLLEHQYLLPKENEVREAVELANLFIGATENALRCFSMGYSIGDDESKKMQVEKEEYYHCIVVNYNQESEIFECKGRERGIEIEKSKYRY